MPQIRPYIGLVVHYFRQSDDRPVEFEGDEDDLDRPMPATIVAIDLKTNLATLEVCDLLEKGRYFADDIELAETSGEAGKWSFIPENQI